MRREHFHGLDTLRTLAIVGVMLYHGGGIEPDALWPISQFGWMGVDLFFVLSGYLIGKQVLRPSNQTDGSWLRTFFWRRACRILPAYWFVLLLYIFVPIWREQPGLSPIWQFFTFTFNFFVDYPKNAAFSHAWSLCVEEQFYLTLPLLVLLLRRGTARIAILCAMVIVAAGVGYRAWELFHVLRPFGPERDGFGALYIERIYYPLWGRMDGLLAGVLLAAAERFRPVQWERWKARGTSLALAAITLIALCCWLFLGRFDSVGALANTGTLIGFPILSLGLAMLLVSSVGTGPFAKWRMPGAKWGALLAYPLYLTHKEVYHLAGALLPRICQAGRWSSLPCFAGCCIGVALLLHLCIERPGLGLRDYKSRVRELASDPAI